MGYMSETHTDLCYILNVWERTPSMILADRPREKSFTDQLHSMLQARGVLACLHGRELEIGKAVNLVAM